MKGGKINIPSGCVKNQDNKKQVKELAKYNNSIKSSDVSCKQTKKDSKNSENKITKDLIDNEGSMQSIPKIIKKLNDKKDKNAIYNDTEAKIEDNLTKSNISSETSELEDIFSGESVESLMEERYKTYKEGVKKIEIRNIKTNEIISKEKVDKYNINKDLKSLGKYVFTYISLNDFNHYIRTIDLKIFRSLFFSCPVCKKPFRLFSLSYHIFQNHFSRIEEFLSDKEIARGCAKLMKIEYKKIEYSLETFSELACIFKSCKIGGNSVWRDTAENEIDYLQNLNAKRFFLQLKKKEAYELLISKFPLNKNKRYKNKIIII